MRAGLPLEHPSTPDLVEASVTPGAQAEARPIVPQSSPLTRRLVLAAILVVTAWLGSRGITNEGSVSLQGDMPRYMMNGVFLYDFIVQGGAWTPQDVFRFAERYYAKYPALSLGHHPPLLPVFLAPVYAVFGVSVFWSRMTILAFFFLAAGAMFTMTRRMYGLHVATWATLLFVTNPAVTTYGQVVLSEMPMLAFVLLAMNALGRFAETGLRKHYAWFVAAVVASFYAKQLALFMLPVYVAYFAIYGDWRRLIRRDVILLTLAGVVASLPMAAVTFVLSPLNVAIVRLMSSTGRGFRFTQPVVWTIVNAHLTLPMLLVVVAGVVLSVLRRDRRIVVGLVWMVVVVGAVLYLTARVDPPRYAMVAVPGYFLCAAAALSAARSAMARRAVTAMLAAAVVYQVWLGRNVQPTGAEGYEAAAQYVLAQSGSPTIMFSGPVDTGYFVFFARKHDPRGQHVILRSDKVFTTSRMSRSSVENRIKERQEIYTLLNKYGTRFVVIEDRESDARVLEWFREELKTDRFVERHRLPIVTADRRLNGVSLVIYEYKDAQPPEPNVELQLNVPLVGRAVRVPLNELIDVERK